MPAAREVSDDCAYTDEHDANDGGNCSEAPQRVLRHVVLIIYGWLHSRGCRGLRRWSRRHRHVDLDVIWRIEWLLDVDSLRQVVLAIRLHFRIEVEAELNNARVQRQAKDTVKAGVARPEYTPIVDCQLSVSCCELKLLQCVHEDALDHIGATD